MEAVNGAFMSLGGGVLALTLENDKAWQRMGSIFSLTLFPAGIARSVQAYKGSHGAGEKKSSSDWQIAAATISYQISNSIAWLFREKKAAMGEEKEPPVEFHEKPPASVDMADSAADTDADADKEKSYSWRARNTHSPECVGAVCV